MPQLARHIARRRPESSQRRHSEWIWLLGKSKQLFGPPVTGPTTLGLKCLFWTAREGSNMTEGVISSPGMYLMGTQFLRRRKSALIDGAGDDARDLGAHLTSYLDNRLGRIRVSQIAITK
jgi:hypothetical protein